MDYARSNLVVYLPQSGDRLRRAGQLWFAVFFAYKKMLGRIRRELVTKSTSGGCDQFETSPEAIDQELRPALCERRQTDRLKTNYRVDEIKINKYTHSNRVMNNTALSQTATYKSQL